MFLKRSLQTTVVAWLVFGAVGSAALVWRPGEGWTDENGSEVSASSSKEQLDLALKLEESGDYKAALGAYRGLVRRWPLSFSAPEAQYHIGMMEEKLGDFARAFKSYQKMLEKYPASKFFDQAIERQFEIANLYLAGEPQRLWKIPVGSSMEKTVEMYKSVIRNAPYGKYAAQCQFNIGQAHEKSKKFTDAVASYNGLTERYPGHDLVDDAQYQVGYAWMRASSEADYDQSAAEKSIEAFEDFLVRFPNSEKVASAKDHIAQLRGKRNQGAFKIAQFYKSQGKVKAAEIYFSEVIKQNPNTTLAEQAEKELQTLRGHANSEQAKKSATEAEASPAAPGENVPVSGDDESSARRAEPVDPSLAQGN
jgi:outer membrane protein assembly factor BamD